MNLADACLMRNALNELLHARAALEAVTKEHAEHPSLILTTKVEYWKDQSRQLRLTMDETLSFLKRRVINAEIELRKFGVEV